MWRNIAVVRVKDKNVDNFTTDAGITIRRLINPIFRRMLRLAIPWKVHIDARPPLEKGVAYIFAVTHSFAEDAITCLAHIDRSAYALFGTTDQIDHNPQIYAAWINGLIYVDRLDPNSRKTSVDKMVRILRSGSSVMLFPEGGWNNSEALPVQPLFAGPWLLAKRTGCQVVPIAVRHEYMAKDVWVEFGEAMSIENMERDKALDVLRDAMATMAWRLMEKHGSHIQRSQLHGDYRTSYMEERKNEYLRVKWYRDVWDEELAFYHNSRLPPPPQKVRESLRNVRITPQNAGLIAPVLAECKEDQKYDLVRYMHENWRKT